MKILTISDSPTIYSGLARVHRHVIDAAVEAGHEVLTCGWFAYDSKIMNAIKQKEISPPQTFYKKTRVIDVPKASGNNTMFAIWNAVELFKPDIIITIGDYWDFWYMHAIKAKTDFAFKWIAYLTIEHDEIKDKFIGLLKYADILAVPSEYGKNILNKHFNHEVELVPYGAEEAFYQYPNEKRQKLRQERNCQDKLRFITVGQNTSRKNIPVILQAISIMAEKDPNRLMHFYIHTNVHAMDPQEAYIFDLVGIAEKLKIENRISFPQEKQVSVFSSPSDDFLADEYNSSDFLLSASICEGFGLPMLEAMACGVPTIANATSTVHEMVGANTEQKFGFAPRGYLVANQIEIHPPARIVQVVKADALAKAIWDVFLIWSSKNKELEGMTQKCLEHGKGRRWTFMKGRIAELIEQTSGSTKIPVEIL